jgi:hypothetical protein
VSLMNITGLVGVEVGPHREPPGNTRAALGAVLTQCSGRHRAPYQASQLGQQGEAPGSKCWETSWGRAGLSTLGELPGRRWEQRARASTRAEPGALGIPPGPVVGEPPGTSAGSGSGRGARDSTGEALHSTGRRTVNHSEIHLVLTVTLHITWRCTDNKASFHSGPKTRALVHHIKVRLGTLVGTSSGCR